jgi:ATP-dependent RNA helicase DeaD
LLGYICNQSKISGRTVGKIDVKGVYSFFEVPHADVEKVTAGFKDADFKGRPVRIEISGEGSSESRSGGYARREGSGGGYNRERSGGGERREGGYNGGNRERNGSAGTGFRDFSGKRREDRPERRRRF